MCSNCAEPTKENEARHQSASQQLTPRFFIDERRQRMIDQLAADFDWGTGDIVAVSYAIREVLKKRFEAVLKNGVDSGD